MSYDHPSDYDAQKETTQGTAPTEYKRLHCVLSEHEDSPRRHGKHLRGGVVWLALSALVLGFPLYLRLLGSTLEPFFAVGTSIFGFFMAFVGVMVVISAWRKEE